ncbi:hypothetical protein CVT24_000247 [Panaeolus cyanescens]|uniref:Major facilitator superfamily (MFS) profile domain-containing protein n=1 Tax=Panaeolus cyanescens TaxID=181874 RepID=A0A409YD32_9AGAR|nr:hypothetical protein CVT24_000247 [Panaeolus cyanescens]
MSSATKDDASSETRAKVVDSETSSSHAKTKSEGAIDAEKQIVVANEAGAVEEQHEYPGTFKLILITLSLCLAIFLVALDNTIVTTAIPKITATFNAIEDVGWYGSAYLLTTASFQLIFGRLYNLAVKRVFLTAILIFEIGSVLCGAAPNSTTLIVGRAIAGLGCAGIFSGGLIIIAHSVPLQNRPIYTSLIGAMWGISSVAGPLLGGVFTDKVTWRWCFYINLPVGGVAALFILIFFQEPKRDKVESMGLIRRLRTFDPLGTFLFIPCIVCLLLVLQWGGSSFAWNDARIIALFVLFGVLLIAFIGVQIWMDEQATVPPRILKNRSIWSGAFFSATLMGAFFSLLFYLPIWFQAIKGDSAVKSGIRILPLIISSVVGSIISGGIVTYTGYYTPFMIISTICLAISCGLLTTLEPTTNQAHYIGYQFLAGFGAGLGIQQSAMAAQNVLEMIDVPVGVVVVVFAQSIGGALAVAVANNLFVNKLIKSLIKFAPSLNPEEVIQLGPTSLKSHIAADVLPGVLKAYNEAVVDAFFVSVFCACVSIIGAAFMEWKTLKRAPTLAL